MFAKRENVIVLRGCHGLPEVEYTKVPSCAHPLILGLVCGGGGGVGRCFTLGIILSVQSQSSNKLLQVTLNLH